MDVKPQGRKLEKNDAEVSDEPERASRRRFEVPCKLRILKEVDHCTELSQLGELLRWEGLSIRRT